MHPSRAVSDFRILRLLGRRRLAAAATFSATLVGCRISSGGAPGEGTMVVRAQALGLTASIDRFEVTASPSERSTWLLADSTGAFGGSLALPAGAQALTATAYAGASAMGTARAKVEVIAGQSADVLLRVRGDQLPARSPLITSLVASTTHPLAGQTISVSATADAGGDPVAFSWTDQGCGGFDSPTAASTTWSRSTPGTCRLTVVASSAGGEDSQSLALTVTVPHPAPAITSLTVSATNAAVGQAVSLSATADAGGDPVHFSWSDRSCGSSFSSPSAPWTVWVHSTPGVCALTVTAKSEGGEDSRTVSITVGTPQAAPTLSSLVASPTRVVTGQIATLTASASTGIDPVTYAWSDQGCGSFSSTTGAVATWSRPTPGTCILTVTASAPGGSASKSVTVSVVAAHPAPAFTSFTVPASTIAGRSIEVSASASAGQDPVSYAWSDQGCGTFGSAAASTTPWSRSTPGTCTLTVTASSLGGSDSKSATVSVHELPPEGTLMRTRVDTFPAPPNGRTAIAPDRCAVASIRRDRTPSALGDLFSFFRASAQRAGDAWYLMASADGGASWTWLSASNAEPNPAPTSDWNHDSTLAQDSIDYKVHHLYWRSGQTRAEYNRIALSHDASGHISGWSWEAENVPGPVFNTDGSNGGYAKMTLNEAVDGNGQKVLVLFAVDQPSGTVIARLVATRTAPGASAFSPTGVASWKKLTDVAVAGYDVLGSYNSNTDVDAAAMANFTHQPADTMQQHTTDHCWQQLPADGSLHAFFGPYYYNDQTTTGQIRRWRLVRSGANWALDASTNGSEVSSSDGITRPQMGGCYASPNFVWLTYGKPGSGLVIDKVGTPGSWISNALPSPDSTPEAWWYAALSVRGDEAAAFLLWERWSLDVHTWRESSGYFDGKEWKVVDESEFWTADGVNGWNGAANWLHGAWPDGLTVFAYPYSDWATNQQRHHSHTISVQP